MKRGKRLTSPWTNGWFVLLVSLGTSALLVFLLWNPWSGPSLSGKTLRLYCAAGLNKPVNQIIHQYQEKYGVTVQATFDGSRNLLSTIRGTGGQGDLYLAADSTDMRDARKWDLVEETIPLAFIRPVLIVNQQTQEKLQKIGRPVNSLQDLLRQDLRVFLANPEGTAIGRVGKLLLKKDGIWEKLEKERASRAARVSTVGTVNQVAQQVRTNRDSIGLVWNALARQFPNLEVIPLPQASEATEQVEIGVLRHSRHPAAALHFARFLSARDQGLKTFAQYYFETIPDADFWEDVPHLHVSAGAMLEPGIRHVLKAFADREGIRIDTSYAGCGILVSQMESIQRGQKPGHFPDAYLSCDIAFAEKVRQWFEPATIILENRLVLIVRKGNPRQVKSLEDLGRPELKIGLPHPSHSALGKLIQALLVQQNFAKDLYDPGKNKMLVHVDAAHTLVNQMCTGHLDLAIVGRSNALSTPRNLEQYIDVIEIEVPGARAVQTFSIARNSRHQYVMKRLLQAIRTPENLERFQRLGFSSKTN